MNIDLSDFDEFPPLSVAVKITDKQHKKFVNALPEEPKEKTPSWKAVKRTKSRGRYKGKEADVLPPTSVGDKSTEDDSYRIGALEGSVFYHARNGRGIIRFATVGKERHNLLMAYRKEGDGKFSVDDPFTAALAVQKEGRIKQYFCFDVTTANYQADCFKYKYARGDLILKIPELIYSYWIFVIKVGDEIALTSSVNCGNLSEDRKQIRLSKERGMVVNVWNTLFGAKEKEVKGDLLSLMDGVYLIGINGDLAYYHSGDTSKHYIRLIHQGMNYDVKQPEGLKHFVTLTDAKPKDTNVVAVRFWENPNGLTRVDSATGEEKPLAPYGLAVLPSYDKRVIRKIDYSLPQILSTINRVLDRNFNGRDWFFISDRNFKTEAIRRLLTISPGHTENKFNFLTALFLLPHFSKTLNYLIPTDKRREECADGKEKKKLEENDKRITEIRGAIINSKVDDRYDNAEVDTLMRKCFPEPGSIYDKMAASIKAKGEKFLPGDKLFKLVSNVVWSVEARKMLYDEVGSYGDEEFHVIVKFLMQKNTGINIRLLRILISCWIKNICKNLEMKSFHLITINFLIRWLFKPKDKKPSRLNFAKIINEKFKAGELVRLRQLINMGAKLSQSLM